MQVERSAEYHFHRHYSTQQLDNAVRSWREALSWSRNKKNAFLLLSIPCSESTLLRDALISGLKAFGWALVQSERNDFAFSSRNSCVAMPVASEGVKLYFWGISNSSGRHSSAT